MNSSPSASKNRRVEGMMYVESVEAQSPPFSVAWMLGEWGAAQVSSSSLDYGLELRGLSPIPSCSFNNVTHKYNSLLKTRLKGLMHVKSVEVQSLSVGMLWWFVEGIPSQASSKMHADNNFNNLIFLNL
ncbi:hypothetical protein TNCV_584411 [Trichonephila clavipes]|nr:hypothetical protein TNCV_584411 [Trichonephila clavipes]